MRERDLTRDWMDIMGRVGIGLLFLIALSVIFICKGSAADGPKTPPLAQLTTAAGPTVVFDPNKIIEVLIAPYDGTNPFQPGAPPPGSGPMMTQVVGIFGGATAVTASTDDVLKLAGADKFIVLTIGSGRKIWIKATAIEWLLPQWPGENDPAVKCYINVSSWSGHPTGVQEDVDTVRRMVDEFRAKAN
jgi:hypothetical protein